MVGLLHTVSARRDRTSDRTV